MKSTRFWVAATIALLGTAESQAQDASNIRLAFNIAEQPLDAALTDFAQTTGLQLLVLSDIAHERTAPKIAGDLTPEAALQQLLRDSGLRYQFVNGRTVAIGSRGVLSDSALRDSRGQSSNEARLAQIGTAVDTEESTDKGVLRDPSAPAIPEVLVKGSRALNMDIQRTRDGAQPYVIFDRGAIEKAGVQTVQEFLQSRLTSNAVSISPGQTPTGDNKSAVNLRGLGTNQTLILVDGHRLASASIAGAVAQPDINGIPLAAIERIEVLPTTSSGAYGGSATGGVVNIILRRDYSGIETTLTYGDSFEGGGASRRLDFAAGGSLLEGRTTFLVSGSYSESDPLLARDRDFVRSGRARALANSSELVYTSTLPPLGATSNIRSLFGNLTLKPEYGGGNLDSNITSVPVGYAGPASDNGAGLIGNAGVYNLDPADTAQGGAGLKQSIYNNPTVKALRTSVRHEITDDIQAFLELARSENEGEALSNDVNGTFVLSPAAPGNPFNQFILVNTPVLGGDGRSRSKISDTRAVAGVIVSLSEDWKAELDFTWERSRSEATFVPQTYTDAANADVNIGALDLFRDTNAFGTSFAQYLGVRPTTSPTDVLMRDLALRVAGTTPWRLGGGAVTTVAMLERRKESLDDYISITDATSGTINYARSQVVESVYLEAGLPLVSSLNSIPAVRALDFTLSVRSDRYDLQGANEASFVPGSEPDTPRITQENKFSSTDYTAAVRYQPLRGLSIRASYGTGFLPPALNQLVSQPSIPIDEGARGFTDPRRGNELLGVVDFSFGGNPDLRPEESESTSIGLVFEPSFVPGLRASIDWVRIDKRDNVTSFAFTQANIENEALLPGIFTRGPASDGYEVGPIIAFNGRFVNALGQRVEGYDLALDYRREDVFGGTLTLTSAATRAKTNRQELLPTIPGIENVGSSGYLKWTANGSATYDIRNWSATWTARYFDGYDILTTGEVVASQGGTGVESQMYHDVSVRYRLGDAAPLAALTNTEFRLAVLNVFNEKPPFFGFAPYYSTVADPRLATYYLSLKKSF